MSNPADETSEATRILVRLGDGDARDADRLLEIVYAELRDLAGQLLARERAGHTLQPTALVHEAWVRLVDQTRVEWDGRRHFLAVGATAMRRILVDHARSRAAEKRGGAWNRVELAPELAEAEQAEVDLVALEEALRKLEELSPRQARVVEMTFFGGLKAEDVAEVLGVSSRTVGSDWRFAKAWLFDELSRSSA